MRTLAISAHPDDETIGCGGSLLAHRASGDDLYWLIVTKAHAPLWDERIIRAKEIEVEAVARAYGVTEYFWSALPSTKLDNIELNQIVEVVRSSVEKAKPQVVYVVHSGDIHSDHQLVFQATTIVLKPFLMQTYGVQKLLSFECLSSTDAAPPFQHRSFSPNSFRNITPYIDRKLEIMKLYVTEMQSELMPRGESAIRSIARYRGATVGVEYAEAFMLIREIL